MRSNIDYDYIHFSLIIFSVNSVPSPPDILTICLVTNIFWNNLGKKRSPEVLYMFGQFSAKGCYTHRQPRQKPIKFVETILYHLLRGTRPQIHRIHTRETFPTPMHPLYVHIIIHILMHEQNIFLKIGSTAMIFKGLVIFAQT